MMDGRVRRSIAAGAVGVVVAAVVAMGPALVSAQAADPPSGPGEPLDLQVSPASDLTDGQTVTVEGQGFVFNGPHRVLQCVRGAADDMRASLDISLCDETTTVTVTHAEGSFTTPFTVAGMITVGGEPVDCVVVGACEIAATFATSTGPPAAGVAIEFAGAQPPPPPVPPFEVDLTIDTSVPFVIAPDGSVRVTGTLMCGRDAEVHVQVQIVQGEGIGADDVGWSRVACGPTPVVWSLVVDQSAVGEPPFFAGPAVVRGAVAIDDFGYAGFTGDLSVNLVAAAPEPVVVTPAFTG